jgi:succinylarginine dihydrolase
VRPSVLLTDLLYAGLAAWVERHYRERLEPADLADPKLLTESRDALDELTRILGLGKVYRFQ